MLSFVFRLESKLSWPATEGETIAGYARRPLQQLEGRNPKEYIEGAAVCALCQEFALHLNWKAKR